MARTARSDGRGISLAKGPAAIVGIALLAFGVIALLTGSDSFKQHAISGTVNGDKLLGFELNGWSSVLCIVAGGLLLLGSPLHWGAKSLALVVGLVLGAAAVIALVDKQDVFGIFAANGPTELGWGVAAVVLLIVGLLPRVGGGRRAGGEPAYAPRDRDVDDRPAGAEASGQRRLRDRI